MVRSKTRNRETMKQTAMQQLLAQLKHERANIPMDIEWDRCYQAIETVIVDVYLRMEKEQIIEAWIVSDNPLQRIEAEKYYNETYKQD